MLIMILLCFSMESIADNHAEVIENPIELAKKKQEAQLTAQTLTTLLNFIELQGQLRTDLEALRTSITQTTTETRRKMGKYQILMWVHG